MNDAVDKDSSKLLAMQGKEEKDASCVGDGHDRSNNHHTGNKMSLSSSKENGKISSGVSLSTTPLVDEEPTVDPTKTTTSRNDSIPHTLICDMGYGIPKEKRPRKERLLAISKQIVNFVQWQQQQQVPEKQNPALIQIVGCPDKDTKSALQERIVQHLVLPSSCNSKLPSNLSISCDSLEDTCAIINDCTSEDIVYLSPDAEKMLGVDEIQPPPKVAIVGLLIDRRVQPNRSKNRAQNLQIVAKRWPLDDLVLINDGDGDQQAEEEKVNPNEPLNVDCVLEGMQQWWWNIAKQEQQEEQGYPHQEGKTSKNYRKALLRAISQAIQHHAKRHPSRPVHLSK